MNNYDFMRNITPSQITDQYWLYSSIRLSFYSTPCTGKWLIAVPLEQLDETWKKVEQALLAGRLGPAAKAATAAFNKTQVDYKQKMIVVYVADFEEELKSKKVLKALRSIGIKKRIKFKRDLETLRGKYGVDSFYAWSQANTNSVNKYAWTKRLK